MSEDELPLEVQFRLCTIKSEIDRLTDLEKAKDLLYQCFRHQLAYEHTVRELLKMQFQQEQMSKPKTE